MDSQSMNCAFKEWALVCEALGGGLQSVIVRKGGIDEGPSGFAFREKEFFLFPTWFHAQVERTRLPPGTPVPEEPGEEMEIRYAATIEWSGLVEDWEKAKALEALHVLAEAVVEERFLYEKAKGVHVAFVRVFRLDPPQKIKNDAKYGGCRSWVELSDLGDCAMVSVISDEEHSRRRELLARLLGI
jgi:hypothetical protein